MTANSLNIKQFPVRIVNIRVQMLSFSYIAYRLPVIVRGICLFDNFEKLSMSLGLSEDILAGWARGCCVHVLLVLCTGSATTGYSELVRVDMRSGTGFLASSWRPCDKRL